MKLVADLALAGVTMDATAECTVVSPDVPATTFAPTTSWDKATRELTVAVPSAGAFGDSITIVTTCPFTAPVRLGVSGRVKAEVIRTAGVDEVRLALDTATTAPAIAYPAAETETVPVLRVTALRRFHFTDDEALQLRNAVAKYAVVALDDTFVSEHAFTSTYKGSDSVTFIVSLAVGIKTADPAAARAALASSIEALKLDLSAGFLSVRSAAVDDQLVLSSCIPVAGAAPVCGGACALCSDDTLCDADGDCISDSCQTTAADPDNTYCATASTSAASALPRSWRWGAAVVAALALMAAVTGV